MKQKVIYALLSTAALTGLYFFGNFLMKDMVFYQKSFGELFSSLIITAVFFVWYYFLRAPR